MDAKHWIRTIVGMFELLPKSLTSRRYNLHRASFKDEFKKAFEDQHVLEGLVEMKLQEFLNLKQGNKTVLEYIHSFNDLAQYAPAQVASDDSKKMYFSRGLSPKMRVKVNMSYSSFHQMVNDAI
ncbi:hypothetical protein U9M48_009135 [Paspalum notatum var. saurae]|uniref:Retrotransposon gag domain-containing protein n=1 Tax=Paspalum notatum var. saurae TaxID=547442 RepID=A0AAQ3WER9_PASNO